MIIMFNMKNYTAYLQTCKIHLMLTMDFAQKS